MNEEMGTIGALIEVLQHRAEIYGSESLIAIEGFDPCEIVLDDNFESDLYGDAKTLICSG